MPIERAIIASLLSSLCYDAFLISQTLVLTYSYYYYIQCNTCLRYVKQLIKYCYCYCYYYVVVSLTTVQCKCEK